MQVKLSCVLRIQGLLSQFFQILLLSKVTAELSTYQVHGSLEDACGFQDFVHCHSFQVIRIQLIFLKRHSIEQHNRERTYTRLLIVTSCCLNTRKEVALPRQPITTRVHNVSIQYPHKSILITLRCPSSFYMIHRILILRSA